MDRRALLGSHFACSCGREHEVPTRRFVIECGAVNLVADVVGDLGLGHRAFLLADPTTYDIAGRKVEDVLEGAGIQVQTYVLPEHPKANDQTIAEVMRVHTGSDLVVSCGSGTITDLAKYLANARGLPLVAVATAPSMNGYASRVVALMRDGVKVTEEVRPAIAVIADVEVLRRAPMEMIRAGLGDAMAKPVCNADWKLASLIRGDHFCSMASELVRDLESTYVEKAAAIGRRDSEAMRALTEALLYSGTSMVLAGSSAPASGGEHLISHTLDMHAALTNTSPDFHGAQVGVATLITAQLYERLFELSSEEVRRIVAQSDGPDVHGVEQRIRTFFGPIADTILDQFRAKVGDPERRREDRQRIAELWDGIRREVTPFLMPSSRVRKALLDAGCKTSGVELGVDQEAFREAVYLARTIRPRFTVLDVAAEFDMLYDFIKEVA